MNTIWSEKVQGIKTLYLTRQLRFDDLFFPQYEKLFGLDKNTPLKILEIGCGPGALAQALHRWYPNAQITAVDRDSNFIFFAKENCPGIEFLEGDATALPFAADTFDVTISNTVQEHVEPAAFWGEQLRVLKKGGVCLCLSTRKGIYCTAPCLEQTAEEEDFWSALPDFQEELKQYEVCQFPMTEAQLPASMEANGFTNVTTGYAVINLTPDSPEYSKQFAEKIIEANRQAALEAVECARSVDKIKRKAAVSAINKKYDKRLALFRAGKKQWDTSVTITMVVRGNK